MNDVSSFATEQEAFWAGEFGDQYASRNEGHSLRASNRWLFARALANAGPIRSVLELGANIGENLKALRSLYPTLEPYGVEINASAAQVLVAEFGADRVHRGSFLEFTATSKRWDLVLCKGVLIHVAPDSLPRAYEVIARASKRLVLLAEYYSPVPQAIEYRGHADRLFKRDFAGEFLEAHPEFSLRDYGFCYRRDPVAPQDDINWFLLERNSAIRASR